MQRIDREPATTVHHVGRESDKAPVGAKLRELIRARELVSNLIRKELKVRYKNSALGFVWSLANPAMLALVFYLVFEIFLPGGVPGYTVYLLSGLLVWTFFSNALAQGTIGVVNNAELVKKVYFPREALAVAPVGANLVHFSLQFVVLTGLVAALRHPFSGVAVLLIPAALIVLVVLATGLSLGLAAVNVQARDTQHLVELTLLAWFWLTPIVYPSATVADRLGEATMFGVPLLRMYLLNPISRVVLAFQRGIYGDVPDGALIDAPLSWYVVGLAYAAGIATVVLVAGWWLFQRLDATLAEEL